MILRGKKGQLTIFILMGIAIITGIILFFAFKSSLIIPAIPESIQPVYNSFLTCLQDYTLSGIDVLETQGGYINIPDFTPGSAYMPFSNQLDFLGNPIPYWYYVSGNNLAKEQVPSKEKIEEELSSYINGKIRNCRFDDYYDKGYEISLGKPEASVSVNENSIDVSLSMDMAVLKGDETALIKSHKATVNSALGGLYDSAKKLYDYEQENLFLENYGVDTLRLYAPVDGVEITCSPLTWNAEEVYEKLQNAIEANTLALKIGSNEDYFSENIPVNHEVRFLNSKSWPSGFEVSPSEENVLVSRPIGNQPGLGILGFCYVPYHHVYNLRYPVLVQVSEGGEIFQFPIAIVIQGNRPREALNGSTSGLQVPELCGQKNTAITINTYDTEFNRIESDISYECSGTTCQIGKTSSGTINQNFPQCVNGFVVAKAEGFKTAREQYSVIDSGSVDIFLNKLYEKEIQLKLDNTDYSGQAMVSFISDSDSKTIVYPEQKSINLSDGQYEVQVYIYRNSSLKIEAATKQQCVDIPESGIGGFLGLTKEKCYAIDFPSQIVSNALSGGGTQNYYVLESELKNSNAIEIRAEGLPIPTTIEQLQDNYILFDEKKLSLSFK